MCSIPVLYRTLVVGLWLALASIAFAHEPISIGVVLTFEHQPPKDFLSSLEGELSAIMGEASFHLHWVDGDHDGQSWDRAFIVRIHGSCSTRFSRERESRPLITLAQSIRQEGSILPYADLDCDRLAGFLHPANEARFGRATGRVLAHELYHILLQTREHSKKGIAKAVQTPSALLSRSLRFQSDDLERFRSVH